MNKIIVSFLILLSFHSIAQNDNSQDQIKHLSVIYDFEGEDFDYPVMGMIGVNDSLYVISQTPNGQGQLFRIDENGEGFDVIWEFDDTTYAPSSIIGNDTVIYGTTRFSENNGGSIFKYSLEDYSLEFIKDFAPEEAQEVQIKYVTDSVLWLSSQTSFVDEGSIATIEKDGTNFTKLYNDTNPEKGQNPVDFIFHNDSIYIACYNGGGVPYDDGVGSTVYSGSFIRIKSDGTGYQNIVKGGDDKGTQPQSLTIREGKLIGQFAYSGSSAATGGQFFRCNLDGSEYDSLGAVEDRALTKMLSTDSLIFGISSKDIFGISPFDGEIRIFDDLLSNSDFGYDVVSNPAYLNGYTFISTQQGGPDRGGVILRWTNEEPVEEDEQDEDDNGRVASSQSQIDLDALFTDPEGDEITFYFDYNPDLILDVTEVNGLLNFTPVVGVSGRTEIEVTAYDGWAGYAKSILTVDLESSPLEISDLERTILFPNPSSQEIQFNVDNIDELKVFNLEGQLVLEQQSPSSSISIAHLTKGSYVVRYIVNGHTYSSKFIKK